MAVDRERMRDVQAEIRPAPGPETATESVARILALRAEAERALAR